MEHLKQILFIDIETVPLVHDYNTLSEVMQYEWARKAKFLKGNIEENTEPSMLFSEKAGVFAEFAKVVCIVVGGLQKEGHAWKLRLKALANDDEKKLLEDFINLLTRFSQFSSVINFCGHNIKEFDIPFLCRRMVVNGLPLPESMQLSGKKPWEIMHLDTMELWKFGDYKHFTSLSLLAEILGIPSPKEDMDGSMVGKVYWEDKDLQRIAKYCSQDVLTTAKVFLKLKGHDIEVEPVFLND
ncbi:MAG: 3'-5' exonuclease [Bacteroidetes bacterium]|nr:3'-5' exonuclease [Bacteroidota bacterium]